LYVIQISLEKVVREAIMDTKGTILHKSVQILAHDDDGVTVQKYVNAVKGACNRLEMGKQKRSSVIDYDKVKIYGKW
jgi:hypothetical protein